MGCFFLGRHIRMTNSPYDPTSSLLRKEGGSFHVISVSLSLTWLLSFLPRFARDSLFPGFFRLIFPLSPAALGEDNDGPLVESERDYDKWVLPATPVI